MRKRALVIAPVLYFLLLLALTFPMTCVFFLSLTHSAIAAIQVGFLGSLLAVIICYIIGLMVSTGGSGAAELAAAGGIFILCAIALVIPGALGMALFLTLLFFDLHFCRFPAVCGWKSVKVRIPPGPIQPGWNLQGVLRDLS